MEAIILAAGLGTRLRPLTDRLPKALVPVAGTPMLERVARRLVAAGAARLIINTHHHADMVEAFVREHDGFGAEVRFSREPGEAPLETGGGVLRASSLLTFDAPVLVHNVDVVTDVPIAGLMAAHDASSVATLALVESDVRSPILVDDQGICGVRFPDGTDQLARPVAGAMRARAFSGVSVLSPDLPGLLTETGRFSIIPAYLRLIAEGHRVAAWEPQDVFWMDIGTHEALERANSRLSAG